MCLVIISRPDFGGRCFLHDGCMAVHGTFLCERVCKSEGGTNDEEKWSRIDAPKVVREEEA